MTLSIKKIEKLKNPGRYLDSRGLLLQVRSATNRSWLFRYERNGKRHLMGLGSLQDVGLDFARSKAIKLRQQIADGLDPIGERERERTARDAANVAAKARAVTFDMVAQRWFDAKQHEWSNKKHRAQNLKTLQDYAFPTLGKMMVGAIEIEQVRNALEVDNLWLTKNPTMKRVRLRIEWVLDYAKTLKLRSGENPAKWKGNLALVMPKPSKAKRKHTSLEYDRVPGFIKDLRTREGVAAKALDFLIMCASRTGEVTGAPLDEIEWENKMWVIPASRMKIKENQEHRVPLTDKAIELLKSLPTEKGNPHLFIGQRTEGLSDMAINQLLKRMGWKDRKGKPITTHGFRSSFRSFIAAKTSYSPEMAELALAHNVGDETYRAYQRDDLVERRREMMRTWQDHCDGKALEGENIVKFKAPERAA